MAVCLCANARRWMSGVRMAVEEDDGDASESLRTSSKTLPIDTNTHSHGAPALEYDCIGTIRCVPSGRGKCNREGLPYRPQPSAPNHSPSTIRLHHQSKLFHSLFPAAAARFALTPSPPARLHYRLLQERRGGEARGSTAEPTQRHGSTVRVRHAPFCRKYK